MAPQNGSTPNFLKAVKIQILPPKFSLFVFCRIMQFCLISGLAKKEKKKVEKNL